MTCLRGISLGAAAVLVAAGQIPDARTVATIGLSADVEYVPRLFAGDIEELRAKGEAEVRIGGRPSKSASSRYSESPMPARSDEQSGVVNSHEILRPPSTYSHQRSKSTQRADSKHKADFALVLPGGHSYDQRDVLKALVERNREQ